MNEDYVEFIKNTLKDNTDFKQRTLKCSCGLINLFFIDNLCDSKFISEYVIGGFLRNYYIEDDINYIEEKVLIGNSIGDVKSKEDALLHVLSGDVLIVFDFVQEKIFTEAKGYVRRSVSQPEVESVLKGPREGFTEAFVDNISLIRRKIKNKDLKFESMTYGTDTNTVIVLAYIAGTAPKTLVDGVKNEIKNNNLKYILDINYLEEKLKNKKTFFDTVGYTEKPDIAASKLLEGRVVIIVDGTPMVITAPYFFVENFQMPDDYYVNKYYANSARIIRMAAFIISVIAPGLYVSFETYHVSLISTDFLFRLAVSRAGVPIPVVAEVLLMSFFFMLLREAGIRLAQPIGQAMSIVGALILGDAAVGAGLAAQSTIVVVALSSICSFLSPKVYGGIVFWNGTLIVLSALLGLAGFIIGGYLFVSHLASLDSCGYPYLFPILDKSNINFKDVIIRRDLDEISKGIFNNEGEK
ncbi:spore germination protein [Clostridium sp. JN-9]|uniref:spore germination protein n=1 Tax=Clostridium sp. JN-9 TaxID=2507159 RepID=UPI000FFE2E18|nr:spore germination protein [Clostridium sp. JN-9]QAT39269.1 spore germination protein [Clostridium sp. JN-9]